jgi:dihydrodipicolinate synthase/N-acetylneuraminate lyase
MPFDPKFTSGVIYPIMPAFNKYDGLDRKAISAYLKHLEKNKAKIILTTAGTSRFNFLNDEELSAFSKVCSEFDGVKILGVPPVCDIQMLRWIAVMNELKPDAVLMVYPDRYYNDSSIVDYFHKHADQFESPVMIHGMFMRNAVKGGMYDFTPGLVNKIKDHPNIIGMKEECTSYELAYKVCRKCADEDFLIFPAGGSCRRYILTHPAGAQNFLGGIGNIYPKIEESFYEYTKNKEYDKAWRIVENYEDPLFEVFGPIGWHRALQAALDIKGLLVSSNRRPFAAPDEGQVPAIQDVLRLIESRIGIEGL